MTLLVLIINFLIVLGLLFYTYNKFGLCVKVYATTFYCLYFCVIPILFFLDNINILEINYQKNYFLENDNFLISLMIIHISTIFYSLGILIKTKKYNYSLKLKKNYLEKNKFYFLIFISVFSFVSLLKYVNGFGGFLEASYYGAFVRQGSFKEMWSGSTSHLFYKRFIFLAILPLLFSSFNKKNIYSILFFKILPLFTLVVLYFFLNFGRQIILDSLLILILARYVSRKIPIYYAVSFIILIFTSFIYLNLDSLTITEDNTSGIFEFIINEFSQPFVSISFAINYPDYLLFRDYFLSLFGNFFPTQGNWVTLETNFINSQNFGSGEASYPPGLVAYSFYNLGLLGVIFYSFFIGRIMSLLDGFFISIHKVDKRIKYIFLYFIVTSIIIVRTATPRFYFYDPTIFTVFIFTLLNIKKNNNKRSFINCPSNINLF